MRKALELDKIRLHILQAAAVFADAGIYLFKETVIGLIQFLQHLLALAFLAHTELVVHRRHMERALKHTQIGEHGQVVDTQIGGK